MIYETIRLDNPTSGEINAWGQQGYHIAGVGSSSGGDNSGLYTVPVVFMERYEQDRLDYEYGLLLLDPPQPVDPTPEKFDNDIPF